jgi:ferredoxin
VEFVSRGRIGIVAPAEAVEEAENAASNLPPELSSTVIIGNTDSEIRSINGHLGAFVIQQGEQNITVDSVLDFFSPPLVQMVNPTLTTLPLGYFSMAQSGQEALQQVLDMRGTFHKPRYFQYQKSLCAHGANGKTGCTRCLDACPTGAIVSVGDKVEVNSYLCQGCGGCVMTCPSGAMRYAYPPPQDTLQALRAAITAYGKHDSGAPTLLFYAADCAADIRAAKLAPEVLPIAVEEVGAIGLEIWLCALAYGAAHVFLYADNTRLAALAQEQQHIVKIILDALGYRCAVTVLENVSDITAEAHTALAAPASFAPDNEKRRMFFMAFNHLLTAAPAVVDLPIDLPMGAMFGEITVNAKKCTLCMACAGACPVSAVRAGGTTPRLLFVEENCVQCGLCEVACPENAITLKPRLLVDSGLRRQARLLNEDKPLLCLECSKPFATERIVGRIEEKLKSHWMFQDEKSQRRLRLCEECRVRDMFDGKGG